MMNDQELNSLIYTSMVEQPSRYQMVKYSIWRVRLFQQLQSIRYEDLNQFKDINLRASFPALYTTQETAQFYDDLFQRIVHPNPSQLRQQKKDNISHFICRMMYCQQTSNYDSFISNEKRILAIRLQRRMFIKTHKVAQMELLKKIIGYFTQINHKCFNISPKEWGKYSKHIIGLSCFSKQQTKQTVVEEYAKIPFEYCEFGLKKRKCLIRGAYAYVNYIILTEIVLSQFCIYLKDKLVSMRSPVIDMISQDYQGQISGFLTKTLKMMNEITSDDIKIQGKFQLSLKNIDTCSKKYFPPCMLNLNQHLKKNNHLKHDGRRQLWLFFKGCGMSVVDNENYWTKLLQPKVTTQELKNHIYNIQHAYGLRGKQQAQKPKKCQSIITTSAPKKDEHHGCPFKLWNHAQLEKFLQINYEISPQALKKIMLQVKENHFQVACGRLWQAKMQKQHGKKSIPSEIMKQLGKSPQAYVLAAIKLSVVINGNNKSNQKQQKQPMEIEKQNNFNKTQKIQRMHEQKLIQF